MSAESVSQRAHNLVSVHVISSNQNISFIFSYTKCGVIKMAKQGMKRPDVTHTKPKNDVTPVSELQGKAKSTKEKSKPIKYD